MQFLMCLLTTDTIALGDTECVTKAHTFKNILLQVRIRESQKFIYVIILCAAIFCYSY